MTTYCIKKINNGEHKEFKKVLKLNANKYIKDPLTLYFDVEGQKIPFLMDYTLFFNIITEQMQNGLIETITYENGIVNLTIRDGNIIKEYVYDFSFEDFDTMLHERHLDILKKDLFKVLSLYKENPNSSLTSEQKYIWLIYDILDGDRIPFIEDKEELLRIFEVYNAHKLEFLESLMENVIFFDKNENVVEYRDRLREKKLDTIRYDIYNQMEIAILQFAQQNDAVDLYNDYLSTLFIPRRELIYKDENGNEITPEVEGGTIFSFGRELIEQKLANIKSKVLKKRTN